MSLPLGQSTEQGAGHYGEPLRTAPCSVLLVSYEEPRRHRNQLWVPDQRVREHPPQRALMGGNAVHRARQTIEETVIETLEGLLDAVVFEVRLAEQLHPGLMVASEPGGARVAGADGGGRGAPGEPPRLHRVHDPAARERIHHVGSVAANHHAVRVRLLG